MHLLPLAVLTALLTAGLGGVPAPASAATASAGTGTAAPDYATSTWGDPWDFSNPEDVLLDDGGPAMAVEDPSVRDGLLRFSMSRPGYLSPVWGGYPGALSLGRDGASPQGAVDADRFRRFSFSAYAARDTPAGLMWFTCEGLDPACQGGMPLQLRAGWHTYDVALANTGYGLPQPWAGRVTGLRLALSPSSSTSFALDWMRLYEPRPTVSVNGRDVVYDVDDDPSDNTADRPGWGRLPCDGECDLAFLPPGTYRFLEGGSTGGPVVLRRPAAPLVLDPDAVGGLDVAAADPWDFNSPADVAQLGNATALGWGDRLTARNTSNDPFVWLALRSGPIDTARFHRLSVTSSYAGPFSLHDVAGGGTHGRVVWQRADQPPGTVVQTKEWVTYSGTSRQTYSLAAPGVHEDDAGNQLPWGTAPVTGLRWDPNEDRGARVWTLDRVALRADDEAGGSFDVRWVDTGYAPGSTVNVYRQDDRAGTGRRALVTGLPQHVGANAFRWNSSATPEGRYWIAVEVTGPAGTATAVSSGPVHVRRDVAGQSPSPATPVLRDLGDACPQSRVPSAGFRDVPAGSVHGAAVDCVAWWGVARGADGAYAPDAAVTRGQMASFLAGVVERSGGTLPADPPDAFDDDTGSVHERRTNQLAAVGVVAGYGGRRYDPQGTVSRQHMATFLVRAYEQRTGRALPVTADHFEDDAGSPHAASIDRAAAAGIAGGVADFRYAPHGTVRRGQMASFLARTLDVLVAGGTGAPPVR